MANQSHLIIHTDGGARGNPGPAAIGFTIKTATGELLTCSGQSIGTATNNIAEVSAVLYVWRWLQLQSLSFPLLLDFYLDSELVVRQLNGQYKIKNMALLGLYQQIHSISQTLGLTAQYHHVPREQNKEADLLVNQALDRSSL